MPVPPPAEPARQVPPQTEQEQRRAWIREANLASDYADDSDDDSLDSFNMRLDQRDLGNLLYHPRHIAVAANGQRRPTSK